MAAAGETFDDARIPEAELLLEPLERAGSESVARVMDVLSKSPSDGEGGDPADWLAGLMMILAGRLRIEAALRDEADDHMRRRIDRVTGPLTNRLGGPFDEDDDLELGEVYDDAEDEDAAGGPLQRGSQAGRNEPCPCGSGKKYKRCCLREAPG